MPKPKFSKRGNVFGAISNTNKSKLPINRKEVTPSAEFYGAPKCKMKVGARIVRPVRFFDVGEPEMVVNIELPKTPEGSFVFRSDDEHAYFTKHAVVGHDKLKHAWVCFCNYDLPEDWIYFIVKGFGKNGKTAFVEPVKGTLEELLKYYSFKEGKDK
jgi:hypothetical protein